MLNVRRCICRIFLVSEGIKLPQSERVANDPDVIFSMWRGDSLMNSLQVNGLSQLSQARTLMTASGHGA